MSRDVTYPFIPRSNRQVRPGHFWQIPLRNGLYACGRVLQIGDHLRYGSRTIILAGLIDWLDEELPTHESIAGCQLLAQGGAHIKCIAVNGGQILGYRSLAEDGIEPLYELSHLPVKDCMLMHGLIEVRLATLQEKQTLYVHSTWSLTFIKALAEMYFVEKRVPALRLPWEELQELMAVNPASVHSSGGR